MRSALTAGVLVGLWSGLSGGSGAAHASELPKRGGTLNFAVVAEPPTTDCHATTTFAMVHPVAPPTQSPLNKPTCRPAVRADRIARPSFLGER